MLRDASTPPTTRRRSIVEAAIVRVDPSALVPGNDPSGEEEIAWMPLDDPWHVSTVEARIDRPRLDLLGAGEGASGDKSGPRCHGRRQRVWPS